MTIILFLLWLAAVLTVAGGITIPLTYVGNNLEVFFSLQMAGIFFCGRISQPQTCIFNHSRRRQQRRPAAVGSALGSDTAGSSDPQRQRQTRRADAAARAGPGVHRQGLLRRPDGRRQHPPPARPLPCISLAIKKNSRKGLMGSTFAFGLSQACGDEKLSDKKRYPTVMRTRPSDRQVTSVVGRQTPKSIRWFFFWWAGGGRDGSAGATRPVAPRLPRRPTIGQVAIAGAAGGAAHQDVADVDVDEPRLLRRRPTLLPAPAQLLPRAVGLRRRTPHPSSDPRRVLFGFLSLSLSESNR